MNDLIEFLRARLDEDERVALGSFRSKQRAEGCRVLSVEPSGSPEMPLADVFDAPTAAHIALHDPARVLREVEAKRRILDEYAALTEECQGEPGSVDAPWFMDRVVLPALALAHSAHPDYREEWKPT